MTVVAGVSILSWRHFDLLLRGRMIASDRVRLLLNWVAWQTVCAAVFGLSLGVYGITSREHPDWRFMAANFIKMPALLFLTSAVTCPSLYVFGALRGLRFSAREFGAMLMVAHTILAAVLGSLAPVIAFFALTTSSYSFMVLMSVFACALAGVIGVRVFVKAIREPAEGPDAEAAPPQASKNVLQLLGWWVALYVFVGAQMGWVLRPFIGSPDLEFILFRGKAGSLVEAVLFHVHNLLR